MIARRQPDGYRWLWLLAVACLCLRLAYVVLHQPLAGFANQFDMLRTTACLGLVPDSAAAPRAATPAAPVERYRVQAGSSGDCVFATEVLLAGTARVVDRVGDALGLGDAGSLPLRLLALTKAMLLLLVVGWIDWRLRAHAGARVVHAWLAALVLADPFNTLYLAGFYTEFAALLTAWLALAIPLCWLLDGRAPGHRGALGWALVLAALALSRLQHALIPLLLVAWMLLLARRLRWSPAPLLWWPALALAAALALQFSTHGRHPEIAAANQWNSLFGTAMPAATDAARFAADLGLPDSCAELIHTSWYLQRGRDARSECPQAFELSRLRWFARLASEPAALVRWIGRGVSLSGQWRPGYLGEVAGGAYQRLAPGRFGLGASLADAVARLPFLGLLAFWAAPLLLPVALAAAAPRRSRARARPLHVIAAQASSGRLAALWLWPMLALALLLGWGTSLVGDGYSELARHLHLAANATLVAILLGLLALLRALPAFGLRGWGLPALAAASLLLVAGGAWAWTQRLGHGVLEVPGDERAAATLELMGWAIDPRGIRAVEAVWADGRRQPLVLEPRPGLAAIFGHAAPTTQFSGRIDVPPGPLALLQIEVIPLSGRATIIDRRWLRPAPSAD